MRKCILFFMMLLSVQMVVAQVMTDQQIIQFAKDEAKAGTSQSQIVTKLMQRGVKIDQIRRLRQQYDKQISSSGLTQRADNAVNAAATRMRTNNAGTTTQDLSTAKVGTTGSIETDASDDVNLVENDVQANSSVSKGTGKKVFGRDIFNNRALTFEPQMNIATPQNYVLGPGDQVVVDIYGASQKTLSLTISPEGTITVPDYGPISVSGLSVAGAQAKLRKTLGSQYASSNLQLTVGQTRSIMVNVMGEVKAPGTYTLSAFATVFHALYRAGGINDLGTLRNVKVYRAGKLVTIVDIYEYILNGRLAGNIMLHDNDVIQVGPYDCLVGITGNIKRPMFYEMRKNESVSTLLKYAGGFTGDANKKSVRLVRQSGERYAVYNVDEFDMPNFKLADGDAITVDGMIDRYENMVEVKGAVFRPGMFQLGSHVTTVKSLVEAAEGVTEDASTSRVVLHRLLPDRSLETVPVDLQGILNGTVADIPLNNEDVLFIPTKEDLIKDRTLTITGEVLSPGVYQYAANTTIEDLIVMAGGLTDQASMAKVDVSRRIRNPRATAKSSDIAKTFTFSLKDGLVIDGDRGFMLEPYDVVHVRRSPAYSTARNITVTGEVNYEGSFTLENKKMRLSDAVNMAGGVTDAAYLRGARLVRVMNDEERVREEATLLAIKNILTENGDSIASNKLQLGDTYVVGIELDKAVANPGCAHDILLREGDKIFVPEYNASVKVAGDVFYPNTVSFIDGKGYKYYVNQAGGFGNRARKSKTFIVYQNGTIGIASKGAKPEPGCEIVVPSKKRRAPFNLGTALSAGTSLASLATMVVALTKL
ncbi:MAG: SLBB domain-containing protein [Prevotella sp.]|nr:SLBB domain-containing protein [Prevotella sp.]